jgi:hypothetical protein
MTNTLHRQGTAESLHHDYIIFACPNKGAEPERSMAKMEEFLRICLRNAPVSTNQAQGRFSALFTDLEKLRDVVEELVEADLGLSIVVSGLMDEVQQCCHSGGIERHSIEHSLGFWGTKNLLPERHILEFNTMCGHGMVSFNLIRKMIEYVKLRRLTPGKAAAIMARCCECGAFNPVRAEVLLEKARKGEQYSE